jgi:hypothetical protein
MCPLVPAGITAITYMVITIMVVITTTDNAVGMG